MESTARHNSELQPISDRERVLTSATLRAAELLALPQTTLARLLGLSAPTVTRMRQGKYRLDPQGKEWELAALFVRLYRALDAITVNQVDEARAWLNSRNHGLNGEKPIALITSAAGLVRVVDYLDAARARV